MSEPQATQKVTIVNPEGLHLRAASAFVQLVKQFNAEVEVIKKDLRANGKSIFDLIALGGLQGTEIEIVATGKDANASVVALVNLVSEGFHKPTTSSPSESPSESPTESVDETDRVG